MKIKAVLAGNVKALMDYAADHKTGEPDSQNALAAATGLGRGTIQRVLKTNATAAAIDTVQLIAEAYKLQAWQLLTPGVDPSNPPVVLITETERALQERLRSVSREFAKHLEAPPTHKGPNRGLGIDRAASAKVPARRRKASAR